MPTFEEMMRYPGMLYPGSDPYNKAEMVREKIPSAKDEALQAPTIDPVMTGVMGGMGGAGAVLKPGGAGGEEAAGAIGLNKLFTYIMSQVFNKQVDKIRNTAIDQFRDYDKYSWDTKHNMQVIDER